MIYVLVIILTVVLIVVLTRHKRNVPLPTGTGMAFVPSAMSDARVAKLGLKQTPEKELGILDQSRIRVTDSREIAEDTDYRGTAEIEWIIDIIPAKDFLFNKDEFVKVFDHEWALSFPSTFYAHFPATNRWSFAVSGDSRQQFDSLEMAIDLAPVFEDEELTPVRLNAYLDELQKRLATFDAAFNIIPRESPEAAAIRSTILKNFRDSITTDIIVVLQSDSRFKSTEFWNTLVDLGLKWGDGDLFHWEARGKTSGDEHLFSVWTSTSPGYFLPEDIAKNKFLPTDLVFGFSLPRSADPKGVFDVMIESMKYCRSRLGGTILDQNGAPFQHHQYHQTIEVTIRTMNDHGVPHGSSIALRMF